MKYLPVSLLIEARPAVVIGGGEVAAGRIDALLGAGAEVTVICPEPSTEILDLAGAGAVQLRQRAYVDGDLDNVSLVMVASDDPAVNEAAWREAKARRVLINVADEPSRCDFIMPSVVRRGELSIAVSTGGKSPALAVRVRQRIARIIGPEFGPLIDVLDRARAMIRDRVDDIGIRRTINYRLVDHLSGEVRHGNPVAVERLVDALIGSVTNRASASASGIVYIVGAGPGDPGLITMRGLECLRSADVILYDRLIGRSLLDEAAPGVELIDVGKRAGDQGRMQRFIEDTMVARANAGQVVCRLKGGDPFVFGRGGEEATALTAAGVAYEIIPGVTSAIAAPAAAGIPVTHRDVAHSFLVMTGSRAENATPEEWAGAVELLRAGGTVVVMMGLAHLMAIVDRLREAGGDPETPAAIVSRGTQPDQDVRVATLATIAGVDPLPTSPGVIVVGAVVRERERLAALKRLRESRAGDRDTP